MKLVLRCAGRNGDGAGRDPGIDAVTTPTTPFPWIVQPSLGECFKPKVLVFSDIELHKDQYGVVATYTCRHGYWFTGGGTTRTNVCFGGKWNIEMEDCEGWWLTYQHRRTYGLEFTTKDRLTRSANEQVGWG